MARRFSLPRLRWLALLHSFLLLLIRPASGSSSPSVSGQCQPRRSRPANPLQPPDAGARGVACPRPFAGDGEAPSSWAAAAPWTHRPYCGGSSYCVFTNANFGGGNHGLSVIATPETLSSAAGQLETAFGTVGGMGEDDEESPYEVVNIPGKGKGIVATRPIRRGEPVMLDHASVLADVGFPGRVKRKLGQDLMFRAFSQLPSAMARQLLALSRRGAPGASPEEDLLYTNTFTTEVDGVSYMGLFPKVSRINHACNPSAFTRFDPLSLSMSVLAFRDIQPGEEVTISYSQLGLTHSERQEVLQRRWGFQCTCDLCKGTPDEVAASDSRRRKLATIREDVIALVTDMKYGEAIRHYEEVLGLVQEERLVEHLGDHYEVLARLYMALGDRGGAEKYASLAVSEIGRFGGPDDADKAAELRGILRQLSRR